MYQSATKEHLPSPIIIHITEIQLVTAIFHNPQKKSKGS